MTEILVALYFGIGVGLTQLLHTHYAHRSYHQKEVRWLEWVPGFSRSDPPFPERIQPLWPPWDLPPLQLPFTEEKPRLRRAAEVLGLHATNLVYCYAMSVVYGVLAIVVVLLVVPAEPDLSARGYRAGRGQFRRSDSVLLPLRRELVGCRYSRGESGPEHAAARVGHPSLRVHHRRDGLRGLALYATYA